MVASATRGDGVTDLRDQLRARLGQVGVRGGGIVRGTSQSVVAHVGELESLGYGAFWFPETQNVFAQAAVLLAGTTDMVICSSVATIYARDAMAATGGANTLAEAYGPRFVLGLGVSHRPLVARRGHEFAPPLSAMREYLDQMDAITLAGALAASPPPRMIGALGPKMLELAGERTAGAHPYCVPVEHTAWAREVLGRDPLLCVEVAVVLTTDRQAAREAAGRYLTTHLGLDNYRNNLLRLGWEDRDFDDDGPLDRLVAWGDEHAIRERVRAHLDAGADHVCIQPLPPHDPGMSTLRELAPALLDA